jgi:drug/metabolite transporter (DMT)-like permease
MNWFAIALSCAFLTACCDALSKRLMKENDAWITGTGILVVSGICFSPVFMCVDLKPVSLELLAVLAVAVPLEILGYYLFLDALRLAPISLTLPILAFTPVFTILTAGFIVCETICPVATVGISLVTVGAYFLNANLVNISLAAPIQAVFSNPGSRRMLMVALIWSVTSAIGKKGVLIYGAIQFGFLLLAGIIIGFAVVSAVRVKSSATKIHLNKANLPIVCLAGLIMAAVEITHFVSLSMAPVACMIAVKRLSMVFGVILGWVFFKEENIGYRLCGASLMVGGVFLLPV